MPVLQYFDISSNLLSEINLNNISINSYNVMAKANQMIHIHQSPVYFDSFIKSFYQQSPFPYLMNFTNNNLTNVVFNVSHLYALVNSVIPISDTYMLQKIASIMLSPKNPLVCDCGMYSDFNFVINGAYSASIKPTGLNTSNLANTFCRYDNITYKIYSLVISKNLSSINKFCPFGNNAISYSRSKMMFLNLAKQTLILIHLFFLNKFMIN
jgi:hypothetical protein